MTSEIIDKPDLIAFSNDLGHDVVWDSLGSWGDSTSAEQEMFDTLYEVVDRDAHTDGDLGQGTTLMIVIRRRADGREFGYSFWQGGGKHGEAFKDANGDEFAEQLPEIQYDWDSHDWKTDPPVPRWYVFQPVERHSIPAYRFAKDSE